MSDNNKLYRNFRATSFAVDNATSIFLLTVMILLFGVQSYNTMPKEQFPEIVIPTIYVATTYAGNSAEDMETLVTIPIEKELASINGVKKMDGNSINDFSNIIVEFNTTVEVDKALQDVKDAVDKAKGDKDFPKDLTAGPNVFEINFSEFPIMTVNLSGDYSNDELRSFGEYLQTEIEKLSEISEVKLKGTSEKEIQIDVDWKQMQAKQISFDDIANAIAMENITMSAGERNFNGFNRSVRVVGEFKTIEDIENIIIKSEFQNAVFIKDVAKVVEGVATPTSIARSDRLPVVSLDVIKRAGENLLSASDQIKEIVEKAKANKFPDELKVTIFNDQSINTRDQVANLQNSIISGVILVVLVLLFFLGLRNAMFVGLAIPLSMLMGILILNIMGITLNVIVLFSLILALGMLVDNSIVVVENIYRYMQEGYSGIDASKKAAGEVAMPIIASTATTLAAFVPLMFWPGIMGEFMGYLPLTLIIVLSSSLFVALVLTPVFASVLMKIDSNELVRENEKGKMINNLLAAGGMLVGAIIMHMNGVMWLRNALGMAMILSLATYFILRPGAVIFQTKVLPWLENGYDRFIHFVLKGIMPLVTFIGVILLLFTSISLLSSNPPKTVFFPETDPLYINAFVELPIGSDIHSTNALMQELEGKVDRSIKTFKDAGIVDAVLSQIGENTSDPAAPPEPGATPNKARITVAFVSSDKRKGLSTFDAMDSIRAALTGYAGVSLVVDRNAEGPPTGKPINLEISGDDKSMRELTIVADDVLRHLESLNVPGVEELNMNISSKVQQDIIEVDREASRRYGLSTLDIAKSLNTALYGREVSKFKDGEDEYPIILRFNEEYRNNNEALMNQMVTFRNMDAGGRIVQVPISAVARKRPSSTYSAVKRKNEKRTITIYSNILEGFNPNEVVEELKQAMEEYADVNLGESYTYVFTGEQEEMAENMAFLSQALLIAIFAIFLILVSQFNSFVSPFIIILSIVFSTIGVLLGYWGTGMDLVVIMTGIGIISLAGIVVNNAIVLIDYINFLQSREKKETGKKYLSDDEVKLSIMMGGKTRLRPVLLTAITTVLGLIPLAIGFNFDFGSFLTELDPNIFIGGDNAVMWGAMSWTIVYGLVFATFLTLVVVPVMYWLFYKITKFVKGLFGFEH
ncbi:efflux RND transporter permease subunit [Aureispira anguillae]|uniref:Efflux RND transporter permease subunit n=1 Tax=Aureispira anguillae TaxID=2864201 RepID=A0A915YKJ8_9BACT|nr:efflux RND transporter permease subunit [Aureispira anguillae]BDS14798.1 efflux RND transporter permease subunit [Aureispira anguillae]